MNPEMPSFSYPAFFTARTQRYPAEQGRSYFFLAFSQTPRRLSPTGPCRRSPGQPSPWHRPSPPAGCDVTSFCEIADGDPRGGFPQGRLIDVFHRQGQRFDEMTCFNTSRAICFSSLRLASATISPYMANPLAVREC